MSLILPDYFQTALSQINTSEIEGKESNPQIDEYLKAVGMPSDDDIPWCAAFVCWCLGQHEHQHPGVPTARSLLQLPNKLEYPELGCLVVLKRGKFRWQGHVGFYLDHYLDHLYLLGGNQNNRVGIGMYSMKKVLGYRVPV